MNATRHDIVFWACITNGSIWAAHSKGSWDDFNCLIAGLWLGAAIIEWCHIKILAKLAKR